MPLIIFDYDLESNVNEVVGGQIDILPTVHHLMGLEANISKYTMGRNLLEVEEGEAIIPKGGYTTEPFYITKDRIESKIPISQKDTLLISELIIQSNYYEDMKGS